MLHSIKTLRLGHRFFSLFIMVCMTLLLLAGCSSGGGGSGGSVTPIGITYDGNISPAVITTTNSAVLVSDIIGTSEQSDIIVLQSSTTLSNSQTAAPKGNLSESDLAHRLRTYFSDSLRGITVQPLSTQILAAAIPVDDTVTCADGGSFHVTGTLNDNYTGTLAFTYTDCKTGAETLNGTVTFRIDAFNETYFIPTDYTATFNVLTLSSTTMNQSISGSFREQLNILANTDVLTINIATRDDITHQTSKAENFVITGTFDNILVPASFTETLSGRIYDYVHGYVDISTPTPLAYNSLNQFSPDSGQLLLTGAANATIRVTALSAVLVQLELDLDGDSLYDVSATLKWSELGGPIGADLADTDGDGMHNSWENAYPPLDPLNADADLDNDGDGLSSLLEYQSGTDPNNSLSTLSNADLVITAHGYTPITLGSTVTYTITVVNWGPASTNDATMTYVLPSNVSLSAASTDVGTCNLGSTVLCNLGTLKAGAFATIKITVLPSMAGNYSNTFTTSSSADAVIINNETLLITSVTTL